MGASLVEQQGNFSIALGICWEKNNIWKVDQGALDHIIGNPSLFHDFKPCFENLMVKIADGSLTKVAGIGSMVLVKNMVLKSVLLVWDLVFNLLSKANL